MFEKLFGKKKSIQRKLLIEFIIAVLMVAVFSIVGFYIFVNKEVTQIVAINIEGNEELKQLLSILRRTVFILLINTIAISVIVIRLATKRVMDPLEKMIKATKEVAEGNFDVRLETQRKDEIEDLAINFNYMVKQLGETEILQKDFIDNVSHEIKTPINSIQGFTKLLDDDNLSKEERKDYIGVITEESDRLLNLSTNILKLSKLQHQDKITKIEQIDISEQIIKTVSLLEPKWDEKNLDFSVDLKSVYFDGDEDLLFQVWTNLIDNAIKFSNQNGKISIKLEERNKRIIVKIKDNGIGMDKEELEKVYTRFYQVDRSHSGEGSGLGLSIVKRIIELSNGNMEIESTKNVGTTITVELPLPERENKILIK